VTEMKADFGIPHIWCIKCRSEQSLTAHYPAPRSARRDVRVHPYVRGGTILSRYMQPSQKLEMLEGAISDTVLLLEYHFKTVSTLMVLTAVVMSP